MRALIRRWLEIDGYVVDEAHTGAAGLQAALEGTHDVAFIDIVLPMLDGYEIARTIRASALPKRICLVALTASTDNPAVAFEAGFDAHVFKPVEAKTIKAVLDEIERRDGQVR